MDILSQIPKNELPLLQQRFGSEGLAQEDFISVFLKVANSSQGTGGVWNQSSLSSLFYEIDFEGKGVVGWREFTNYVIGNTDVPSTGKGKADISTSADRSSGPTISAERIGLRLRSDPPVFADQCSQLAKLIFVPEAAKWVAATTNRVTIHDGSSDTNAFIGKAKVTGGLADATYHPATSSLITASTKGVVEVFDTTRNLLLHRTLIATCPVSKLSQMVAGANILFAGDTSGSIMALDATKFSPLAAIDVPLSNASLNAPTTSSPREPKGGLPSLMGSSLGNPQKTMGGTIPLTGVKSCSIRAITKFSLVHHTDTISALSYIQSSRFSLLQTLLTAGMDNMLAVCDIESRQVVHYLPSAHELYVRGLDINPHRSLVVTYGSESTAGIVSIDTQSNHQRPTLLVDAAVPHSGRLVGVVCADEDEVITADIGGMIKLWDLRMLRCVQTGIIPQVIDATYNITSANHAMARVVPKKLLTGGIAFNPVTQQLFTLGPTVSVFDREVKSVCTTSHQDPIVAIAWNPFTFSIITATPTDLAIWDVKTGIRLALHANLVAASSAKGTITCLSVDHLQAGRRLLIGTTGGYVISFIPMSGAALWAFSCVDSHLLDRRMRSIAFCEAGVDHNIIVGLGAGCIKAFRENFLSEPCRLLYVPPALEPIFGIVGEESGITSRPGDRDFMNSTKGANPQRHTTMNIVPHSEDPSEQQKSKQERYAVASALLQPDTISVYAVSPLSGMIVCAVSMDGTLVVLSTVTRRCHVIASEPHKRGHKTGDRKALSPRKYSASEILSICFLVEHPWDVIDEGELPVSFPGSLSLFATGDVLGRVNVYSYRAHDPHNTLTTDWLTTIRTESNVPCHSLSCSQKRFLVAGTEKGVVTVWDMAALVTSTLVFEMDDSSEHLTNSLPHLSYSHSAFGESSQRKMKKRSGGKRLPLNSNVSPLSSPLSTAVDIHSSKMNGGEEVMGEDGDAFAFPTSQRRLEQERLESGMHRVRECMARAGNLLRMQPKDNNEVDSRIIGAGTSIAQVESSSKVGPSLGDVLLGNTMPNKTDLSAPKLRLPASSPEDPDQRLSQSLEALMSALKQVTHPRSILIQRGDFALTSLGEDSAAPLVHCVSLGDVGIVAISSSGVGPTVILATPDGRLVGPLSSNRQESAVEPSTLNTPLINGGRAAPLTKVPPTFASGSDLSSPQNTATPYRFTPLTSDTSKEGLPRVPDITITRLRKRSDPEDDNEAVLAPDIRSRTDAVRPETATALADSTVPPLVKELVEKENEVKDRRAHLITYSHRDRECMGSDMDAEDLDENKNISLLQRTLPSIQQPYRRRMTTRFGAGIVLPLGGRRSLAESSAILSRRVGLSTTLSVDMPSEAMGSLFASGRKGRPMSINTSNNMPLHQSLMMTSTSSNAPAHHTLFLQYANRRDLNATPDEDEDEYSDGDGTGKVRRRPVRPKYPAHLSSHSHHYRNGKNNALNIDEPNANDPKVTSAPGSKTARALGRPIDQSLTNLFAKEFCSQPKTARGPSPNLLNVRRKHASPRVQVIGSDYTGDDHQITEMNKSVPLALAEDTVGMSEQYKPDLFTRLSKKSPSKNAQESARKATLSPSAPTSPRGPQEISIRSRK